MSNKCSLYFYFLLLLFVTPSFLLAQSEDKVIAVVNGNNITQSEIDNSIIGKILPLQEQINIIRKVALENLILKTLLEEEAKKKGISVEELRRNLTVGKVEISPNEIEKVYVENAAAFASMSPDEIKERLRLDLEVQARMKMYRESIQKLKKQAKIEVNTTNYSTPKVSLSNEGSILGNKNAPITIVEFSDFQCPYCRESFEINKQILQIYGDKVKFVFKHLPLHSKSFSAAQASFCADRQGKFRDYHDALFALKDFTNENLDNIAEKIGLNLAVFKGCVNSELSRSAVLKDAQEAQRLGIDGTPSFFVNGRLIKGVISLEDFTRIIESEFEGR